MFSLSTRFSSTPTPVFSCWHICLFFSVFFCSWVLPIHTFLTRTHNQVCLFDCYFRICLVLELCSTYPHISGWGTHHGWCSGRSNDGRRGQAGGEGREGVLVGVLVLVHVLVLVKLGPQEGHGGQGGRRRPPVPLRTLNQEAVVQLLPQEIMLCKKGERGVGKKKEGKVGKEGGERGRHKKGHGSQSVLTTAPRKKRKVVTWHSLFLQLML